MGEAYAVLDRHYYSSHDYNCLHQGMLALPTKDGMFVLYLSRISTDQVAGFGSGAKHFGARALVAPHIKDLLEILRLKAEKQ